MTLTESFNKWLARIDHAGLPWQTSKDELLDIFTAGFHAGVESTKQQDLFPGTISSPVAQSGLEHLSCKQDVASSNLVRDSITAEVAPAVTAADIYAAYPRKVGKQAAVKAIKKACALIKKEQRTPFDPAQWLLNRVKEFAAAYATWPANERQYCPHPASWMNAGRYDDNPAEWVRGAAAAPSQFRETK